MLKKIVTVKNLLNIYETEISKGVKNKKKLINFEKGKMCYINDMVTNILNETYKPNKYNIFLIYEPTLRLVMSSSIYDKVINHFVTRHILEPKLSKYLNNRNCATRKNMGTSYALKLFLSDIEKNKKYDKCYFLKLDIKKYFYNIDHNVLKSMIKNDLDEDEFNLVCKLIDCTNEEYINEIINKYRKQGYEIPIYKYDKGLSIGARTNQFFAILYLSKLQHYIIHNLHLKYIINYMDDYIIIHHNKEYLNNCLKEIENKLNNEYKLVLNKNKTYIKSFKEGIVFLGYNIKVINKKTIIKLSRNTKNNIKNKTKKLKYLYNNEQINFQSLFSSLSTYKNSYIFVNKYITRNIVNKYF